jgi:hypothetical protein
VYSQESYNQGMGERDISGLLDGHFTGKTNTGVRGWVLDKLSKGKYTVMVLKEGFQPQE